jgi:hypothetical protein
MLHPAWTLLPGLLLAAGTRPAVAQLAARDSAYLATTTQALLDAITAGDSTVWARHLAPAWVLADEEGRLITRSTFLAGLHPLPPGQQGKLTLTRRHLTGGPAVAVISYDADEEHHYYGHVLPPRRTWVLGVRARHVRRGHDIGQLAG